MSKERVLEIWRESAALKEAFFRAHAETIARMAAVVTDALAADRKVLLFGNGGSAADAQHIAAELVGRFRRTRPGLPALALTTDTSALTAIANDFGYDRVFEQQLLALGRAGDVAIAISTSGNSPNVVRAARAARERGLFVAGFLGGDGGQCLALCDSALVVAHPFSARVQEIHIMAGHILCELAEEALAARGVGGCGEGPRA